jgi:hypothetical protein
MDFRLVQHADPQAFAMLLEKAISELADLGHREPAISFSHTATPDPGVPYHYAAIIVAN